MCGLRVRAVRSTSTRRWSRRLATRLTCRFLTDLPRGHTPQNRSGRVAVPALVLGIRTRSPLLVGANDRATPRQIAAGMAAASVRTSRRVAVPPHLQPTAPTGSPSPSRPPDGAGQQRRSVAPSVNHDARSRPRRPGERGWRCRLRWVGPSAGEIVAAWWSRTTAAELGLIQSLRADFLRPVLDRLTCGRPDRLQQRRGHLHVSSSASTPPVLPAR